jgi:hypothetical protein
MAAAPKPAPASRLLIDQYLPRYDLTVVHAEVFPALPQACYRAARDVDLLRAPIIRLLLDLRVIPQRLADLLPGRRNGPPAVASPRTFRLDDMVRVGGQGSRVRYGRCNTIIPLCLVYLVARLPLA